MSGHALPRVGLRLHGGLDPHACIALAKTADTAGLASVWFAENPFHRGVLPAAAACAAVTRRVTIGIGVVIPYSRHPTLIAMEFAALDELSHGRAVCGIGSGLRGSVGQMGMADDKPIAALRNSVAIVRGMLRGETVRYNGRVFSADGARLGFPAPRADLPLYLAAMGPQSLRLAGRIADGVIISNMVPPAHAAEVIGIACNAAEAAGRPSPEIVQYVPCVARPDRLEARNAVKPAIAGMLTAFWPAGDDWQPHREASVRASGIPRGEFAAALTRLRAGEAATSVLDDRFVDAFSLAGTADDCLRRARAYGDVGVTELGLGFVGARPEADIGYFGAALPAA